VSRAGGAAIDPHCGNAEPVANPSNSPADRKPGYSRAELVKDLRCSRARELGLDATAAHVREKLMVFANGDRETFVSVSTLAAAIGRSEKTIRRALSRLYKAGEVVPRIEVTAWGRRNVYRLAGTREAPGPVAAAVLPVPAADGGATGPTHAPGQNDPMGTVTVTRPPPPDTLLSDRDQKNVPPPPPLVVAPDVPSVPERVLARWRERKLPALDEHRARVAIGRRVAEGVSAEELLDAVDGAYARSASEGWAGVCSAFAVVMAGDEGVRFYARRGRELRAARDRCDRHDPQPGGASPNPGP
jgi:predicted transcriptional regulator